jgi:hypothetical protein
MSFMKKHWAPLCLGAGVLVCGSIVLERWIEPEPAAFSLIESDTARIRTGLANPVSPQYPYSQSPDVRLHLAHAPALLESCQVPPNLMYPRLLRPVIDPDTRPVPSNVTILQAALPAPVATRSSSDHGRVCIEFQAPTTQMFSVRAEIFRGSSANSMDVEHPYGSIEIPAGSAADAWLKFVDTRVEPKRAYFYRIRLTAAAPSEISRIEKDETGRIVRELRWLPPVGSTVCGKAPNGAVVYASEISPPLAVSSPSNFEVRFSGTSGSVPLAGQPAGTDSAYTGRFAIRVWISDAQDWKETTLEVREGEPLAGKVLYVPKGAKDSRVFRFDTRLMLEDITRVLVQKTAEVREQVMDPDNAPELDQSGQPKVATRTVRTSGIPKDVATLRDLDTGKRQELTK